MADAPLPEIRASDADRERTAERLRRAAGEGQLTLEELDERLNDAYASRTRGELERLTADLQAPAATAPRTESGLTVRRGEGGARWLVAIMGGCERYGRWRLSPRATSINLMGGAELDLTQAELADDHVELTVFSLMGGAEICVPDDLRVELSEFAFMGGNSVKLGESRAGEDAPVLRLRLVSIMGGTDVRREPKLSWSQRRALKKHGH